MPYSREDMDSLASEIIRSRTAITGVQPKLSLNLDKHDGAKRLSIVGLWGNFIFKPQTSEYKELPENEDVTMHLAELSGIKTAPHCLIRLADGSLGYLTRRIDREWDGRKLAMEDFCQLTGRPTEYKYRSSYERIGKAIRQYSSVPQMDSVDFVQLLLFCFLTGNNDMHLKNFSLYSPDDERIKLAPAYDLVNASIANPKDREETALTLNGKKSNLRMDDFQKIADACGVQKSLIPKTLVQWGKTLPKWDEMLDASFLSDDSKTSYKELVTERFGRLAGGAIQEVGSALI